MRTPSSHNILRETNRRTSASAVPQFSQCWDSVYCPFIAISESCQNSLVVLFIMQSLAFFYLHRMHYHIPAYITVTISHLD
jgi:hypothetical protein